MGTSKRGVEGRRTANGIFTELRAGVAAGTLAVEGAAAGSFEVETLDAEIFEDEGLLAATFDAEIFDDEGLDAATFAVEIFVEEFFEVGMRLQRQGQKSTRAARAH